MKTKLGIIAAFLFFLLCALLWLRRPPEKRQAPPGVTSANNPPIQEQSNGLSHPEFSRTQPTRTVADQRTRRDRLQDWNSRSNDFYQAWVNSNVPLDFYGEVVDESSNAIAGAIVSFIWNKDDMSNPFHGGENALTTQSDSAGLFSLQGERGRFLDIRLSKSGYYTPRPGVWSFRYSGETRFSPDSPVVFVLRKKGEGEPLIQWDWPSVMGSPSPQLRRDGTPMEIDLLNGKIVEGGKGQLKLEYRSEEDSTQPHSNYDWDCHLTLLGGGLLETAEEFAFEAPESGYQPTISIDMPATKEHWQEKIRSKYFIRLPDGRFGRIDFYLQAYNGVFNLHAAINPAGSRNLEPAN